MIKKFDHRFGMISSLVAKQDIQSGEEDFFLYLLWSQYCFIFGVITKQKNVFAPKVTVNYRLPLHLAPSWFRDCWTSWQQDLGRKNMKEEKEIKDLKRKALEVEEKEWKEWRAGDQRRGGEAREQCRVPFDGAVGGEIWRSRGGEREMKIKVA